MDSKYWMSHGVPAIFKITHIVFVRFGRLVRDCDSEVRSILNIFCVYMRASDRKTQNKQPEIHVLH